MELQLKHVTIIYTWSNHPLFRFILTDMRMIGYQLPPWNGLTTRCVNRKPCHTRVCVNAVWNRINHFRLQLLKVLFNSLSNPSMQQHVFKARVPFVRSCYFCVALMASINFSMEPLTRLRLLSHLLCHCGELVMNAICAPRFNHYYYYIISSCPAGFVPHPSMRPEAI